MRQSWYLLGALALLPLFGCGSPAHGVEEKYFLVSINTKLPYWQQAIVGFNRAARQLQVKAEVVGPESYDPAAQHRQFQDLLKQKPTGILVSASDSRLLKEDIDAAIAQGIPVIAIDADSVDSRRLTFIGTDNYRVGTMGGKIVAERLHNKGNVVVFTIPEQGNLKERLRGYTDVFADHPGIKIASIIDMKGDPRVAFDKTMELFEKKANVDAIVCLVSTAAPEVAEVLGRKSVTGKVVVAMDTDQRTLEGIQKGLITATISQKPFTMAYMGLRMLDDLHHHPLPSLKVDWARDSFSPMPVFIDTGSTLIDKSTVDAFIQQRNSEASQ
jgi:ribose transport system substrate-binding protein